MYALFIFGALLCSSAYGQEVSISLPEAQNSTHGRALLSAYAQDVESARHTEKKEWANYLPTFSANHTSTFTRELGDVTASHSVALVGSQLIYSPTGPQVSGRIAHLSYKRAKQQSKQAHHTVIYKTAVAFLAAWLLQEKHGLVVAHAEAAQKELAQATKQFSAKQITAIEFNTFVARAAHAQAALQSYTHEVISARTELCTEVGDESLATAPLSLVFNAIPARKSLDEYCMLAHKYRPEVTDNTLKKEQQSITASSQRASYLPSLNANTQVGHAYGGTSALRGTTASLGVSLSWRFFDGMKQLHAARATDAGILKTSFEHKELLRAITNAVTADYNALASSTLLVDAAAATERAVHAAQKKAEKLTASGVHNSVTLARTRAEYEKALYDYKAACTSERKYWETLLYHCGYPPELTERTV
jgi:outer membrane protein TolC